MKLSKLSVRFSAIFIAVTLFNEVTAVSLVYNFRISEATSNQIKYRGKKEPFSLIGVVLSQWRQSRDKSKQYVLGALGTIDYEYKSFYFSADFGGGHVKHKKDKVCFSRTQSDDILFGIGYGRTLNDRTRISCSGLLGVPTHKDLVFEGIQMGTGHFALGLQGDTSIVYSKNRKHSILGAARIVHFFPRQAGLKVNIAPNLCNTQFFDVKLGNLADLLVAFHSIFSFGSLEVGYNPSFAFGTQTLVDMPGTDRDNLFIRSGIYGTYRYLFLINKKIMTGLEVGLSYSFDHNHDPLSLKKNLTFWASWDITF